MSVPPAPVPPPGIAPGTRHRIRLMVLAMTAFIANDALVKVVSEGLPAGQLILVRGLMATALVWAVARATAGALPLRHVFGRWVLLRTLLDALATVTYLVSLFHLPIANATAINMATPLVIALLAGPMLGQRVGARRWLLIGAGFAGVLLVVQPGPGGFNAYAWLCVLATLFNAARDLVTPRIAGEVSSMGITLSTTAGVTVAAALMTASDGGFVPMSTLQVGQLAAAAVFLAAGHALTIAATRGSDLATVSPFRYSALVVAVALGWLVWGEAPNLLAWGGIALLIASGVALLRMPRD
jgi:drug/metabolite transporter (DMT)-like permease